MHSTWRDVRFGLRMLWKNPGFTLVSAMVLALGIGANTAIFSLINSLLLRPLPVERPEELVGCYNRNTVQEGFRGFSYPNYCDLRERNTVFSHLLAYDLTLVGVREGDATRRVFTSIISSNYFAGFGARLFRGREFLPEEEIPGSNIPVAIVSYRHWKRAASDPDIIGKAIHINSRPYTIVGIAPEGFTGGTSMISTEIYLPLGAHESVRFDLGGRRAKSLDDRTNHPLLVVGRLRTGTRAAEADAQLAALAAQLAQAHPEANKDYTCVTHALSRIGQSTSPMDQRPIIVGSSLLMFMAGIVLLIACINLANMLLGRSAARRREMAIRLAIGGARGRIVRQLLSEGMLLSLIGSAAGLVFAYFGMSVLMKSMNQVLAANTMFVDVILQTAPDVRVLLAATFFCVLATLLFGIGPAWRLSQSDIVADLKDQAGQSPFGPRRSGVFAPRNILVSCQIALSLALLTAAGLFMSGALKGARVDPGFDLSKGLIVEVDPGLAGYDSAQGQNIYQSLITRLRGIPGIESVSVAATVPFGSIVLGNSVRRAGPGAAPGRAGEAERARDSVDSRFNAIGAGYFRTLGISLLQGREFSTAEAELGSAPRVAIIDELLARRLFPEGNALGRHIQLAGRNREGAESVLEVVGVVATLTDEFFVSAPQPHVYVPYAQDFRTDMTFHLKVAQQGRGTTDQLLQSVRAEIRAFDDRLPLLSLKTFESHLAESAGLWLIRAGVILFGTFGGMALFLAVVGVYGVRSYSVALRTREIGIRMALGATAGETLWLILREGLWVTLLGIGIGWTIALGVAQLLSSMLYEVSATDPAVFLGAALSLAAAALLACYIPARRAARVDPMQSLRAE